MRLEIITNIWFKVIIIIVILINERGGHIHNEIYYWTRRMLKQIEISIFILNRNFAHFRKYTKMSVFDQPGSRPHVSTIEGLAYLRWHKKDLSLIWMARARPWLPALKTTIGRSVPALLCLEIMLHKLLSTALTSLPAFPFLRRRHISQCRGSLTRKD